MEKFNWKELDRITIAKHNIDNKVGTNDDKLIVKLFDDIQEIHSTYLPVYLYFDRENDWKYHVLQKDTNKEIDSFYSESSANIYCDKNNFVIVDRY